MMGSESEKKENSLPDRTQFSSRPSLTCVCPVVSEIPASAELITLSSLCCRHHHHHRRRRCRHHHHHTKTATTTIIIRSISFNINNSTTTTTTGSPL
jgi:hypothetical protein